jgi:hypothetical protein
MASTRQPTRPQPARQRPARRGAGAPLILGYAAAAYLLFLAVLAYAIGFFAGAGVPTGIDSGTRSPWPLAVAVNLLLLLLFAVQPYRRRVPALIPALRPRSRRGTPSQGGNPA